MKRILEKPNKVVRRVQNLDSQITSLTNLLISMGFSHDLISDLVEWRIGFLNKFREIIDELKAKEISLISPEFIKTSGIGDKKPAEAQGRG
jgi:hypothetical protein